ncbi:class I SAM-dependent methyltransferase [Candidatus Uhrbacteria bacterium]|nr:class I SAM-dependent methyltransferase [Candidatus Uhrbacteria bacterium]
MNKSFNQRPNDGRGRRPVTRKTSWGKSADWYNVLLEQGGTYQSDLILPNLKRLVAPKKGEKILDLACGQGFFSREFALAGARVCGVDISPELIAKAKIMSPSLKIDYQVSPAHELDAFEDGSFDKVISVLAIQNIHNPDEVFKACERVLVPNGSLFLVLNHPAFRIPTHSSWGWDDQDGVQYRRVDRYLSEFKSEIQMHPGSNSSEVTFSYHRPLQTYFKWLRSAGFQVRNVEEWASNKTSDSGPRANAENSSRREIPLFMYLEAVKSL